MICKCSFQRFFLDFSQGSRLNYPHSANFRALILPAVGASGIGHGVSNRQVIVIHLTSKTQIAETQFRLMLLLGLIFLDMRNEIYGSHPDPNLDSEILFRIVSNDMAPKPTTAWEYLGMPQPIPKT